MRCNRAKSRARKYRDCAALLSIFCCTAISPIWAFPQDTAPAAHASTALAVTVGLGEAQGGRTQADVQLHNLTDKTITAYEVALTVSYYDGSEVKVRFSEDLLHLIAIADAFPDATFPSDGGFLGAGQTRIYRHSIADGPGGIAPVSVEGTAVAVIYKDRTAVGDPDFIQSDFAQRGQRAQDMAAVMSEMDRILSDPEIHQATTEARNFPSAEKKSRQWLSARMESLNKGTTAEKRRASDLRRYFYDPYPSGGPLLMVQGALDGYKAQQAAYAAGSTRQEAK
jgi:hypothetical protein